MYRRLAFAVSLVLCAIGSDEAEGGIGPENLVVVVNAASADSRTIANHYVQWRQVPSSNVIFLEGIPTQPVVGLEEFRERILRPLLQAIDARNLAPQIRAVAYSAGFPYAVNVQPHAARITDANAKKLFTPVASLNGLTYFFRFVLADSELYLSPQANFYARMPWERHFENPFQGDNATKFDEGKKAQGEGRALEGAEIYRELYESYPTLAPLAILAARGFASAGKADAAIAMLQRAVESGWTSGSVLRSDPSLASLKDRTDFEQLVASLADFPALTQHAIGFEGARGWTKNGWWLRPDEGGITYLPSFLLAVPQWEGTTLDEAVEGLRRSSSADNSFPRGTYYFSLTGDIRTTSRKNQFPEAVLMLKSLGHDATIDRGAIPQKKSDILGLTSGTAEFDWLASGSQFLPGALGDNLTSFGGVMHSRGQTKLTEFLRGGAAAACGTVTEPYVVNDAPWQFKFPLPQLHAYYAQGATAAEAFYLAVSSPYQLLIVGDPLCQPFARQPAELVAANRAVVDNTEMLVLKTYAPPANHPSALPQEHVSPLSEVEIYLDGKLLQRSAPVEQFNLPLGELVGGSYELRLVLVGEPRLAPRKTILTWIDAPSVLAAPRAKAIASGENAATNESVKAGGRPVQIELAAIGADRVHLYHFDQLLGTVTGNQGVLSIDLRDLGRGPIRMRAVADYRGTRVNGKQFIVP